MKKVAEHSVCYRTVYSAEIGRNKTRKEHFFFLTQAGFNSEEKAAPFTLEQAPY